METISSGTLQELLEPLEAPCVSILLPVPRGTYDQRQARLDLKNLVAAARVEVSASLRPRQTEALLAPAEQLLGDGSAWPEGGGGMALFLSPSRSLQVHLPATVEPMVMVGEHFAVLSLLPVLYPDCRYHVLALSRNSLKLYQGTRYSFEECHLPDLPKSLDDALWYERHENVLISHGGVRLGNSAQPTSVLHGGQAWQDERKDMFERYYQHIDKVLEPALFAGRAPLVLAAVEREISGFGAVSRHPSLCEEALVGNPDGIAPAVLRQRAWDVVRRHLDSTQRAAVLDRFHGLVGTGRRSVDADQILEAASVGRVETVLVPEPVGRWSHAQPRPAGGVDHFVNNVVIHTMRHGGTVTLVPPDALPAGVAVAAIFRWQDETEERT